MSTCYRAARYFEDDAPKARKFGNGFVCERDGAYRKLLLFDNIIAIKAPDGAVWISDAGFPTLTTKRWLNELDGVSVYSDRKVLHLNGQPWDGSPTRVESWEAHGEAAQVSTWYEAQHWSALAASVGEVA